MSHSRRASVGFTLLELLVVISIVGILAAMALPGFGRTIERSRVRDTQATLASLYSAERVYRLDQTTYGTLANLVANRYLTDPNAGNANWVFSTPTVTTSAFTATATRVGGGYADNTVTVDQNFSGTCYGGNHPDRDAC